MNEDFKATLAARMAQNHERMNKALNGWKEHAEEHYRNELKSYSENEHAAEYGLRTAEREWER